jgi:hypothetical protein
VHCDYDVLHVEVSRKMLTASTAVSAQQFRHRWHALPRIGMNLGDKWQRRSFEILEAHAQISNIGPRIADCAEFPVENGERAARRCAALSTAGEQRGVRG